ncbi:hypothetical protein G6L37_05880 [Agrobacterium rubi]|nr:hypothetical protein [Agrobacterium rubi]NTF24889.1 hypothetical protein [Agrobacterium rubi]
MSIWNITSPSDPVTIDTDDFKLAAFFTCILGNGLYFAKEWGVESPRIVPFMTEEGFDDWFVTHFGAGYEASAISIDKAALAAVFDTVIVGTPEDRAQAEAELAAITNPKRRKLARQRINRDRASTGWQIFEHAEKWADKLRKDAAHERKRKRR